MTDSSTDALEQALALHATPDRLPIVRRRPLPGAMLQLIRIAAGDEEALAFAAGRTSESPRRIADAARFYIQQVLFDEGADSYRVLGVRPDAPGEAIKEHYRWLTRWLHPDRHPDRWDVVYAERVNRAWNTLSSEQRRQDYDARQLAEGNTGLTTAVAVEHPVRSASLQTPALSMPQLSQRTINRMPTYVLGTLAVSAMFVLGFWYWIQREGTADDALGTGGFDATAQVDESSAQEAAIRRRIAFDERVAELSQPIEPPLPARPAALPPARAQVAIAQAPLDAASERAGTLAADILPADSHRIPEPDPMVAHADGRASPVLVPMHRDAIPAASLQSGASASVPLVLIRTPPPPNVAKPPKSVAAVPVPSAVQAPERLPPAATTQRDASTVREAVAVREPPQPAATGTASPKQAMIALPRDFVAAYGMGDLGRIMQLFTADAADNRGGIDAITEDYQHLFQSTSSRSLDLGDLEWSVEPGRVVGSGIFHARIHKNGELFASNVKGWIHIEAVPIDGVWKIHRILHRNAE